MGLMNRSEFHHLLSAVIPHAGCDALPGVGLKYGLHQLFAYATDRYTIGIDYDVAVSAGNSPWEVHLPLSEAKDLARWIKPAKAAERDQAVRLAVQDDELHIGHDEDSAVFELTRTTTIITLAHLEEALSLMGTAPHISAAELPLNPKYAARFGAAARTSDDVLTIDPRVWATPCALVTVGDTFRGAIAPLASNWQEIRKANVA